MSAPSTSRSAGNSTTFFLCSSARSRTSIGPGCNVSVHESCSSQTASSSSSSLSPSLPTAAAAAGQSPPDEIPPGCLDLKQVSIPSNSRLRGASNSDRLAAAPVPSESTTQNFDSSAARAISPTSAKPESVTPKTWRWNGRLKGTRTVSEVSWGVSCLMTACRENQDGWAVEMWGNSKPPLNSNNNSGSSPRESGEWRRQDSSGSLIKIDEENRENIQPANNNAGENSNTRLSAAPSEFESLILSDCSESSKAFASSRSLSLADTEPKIRAEAREDWLKKAVVAADVKKKAALLGQGTPLLAFSFSHEIASASGRGVQSESTSATSTTMPPISPKSNNSAMHAAQFGGFGLMGSTTAGISPYQLHQQSQLNKGGRKGGRKSNLSPPTEGVRRNLSGENIDGSDLETSGDADINAITFIVLDGHGAGGRDASAAVEKAFDRVFSQAALSGKLAEVVPITPPETKGQHVGGGNNPVTSSDRSAIAALLLNLVDKSLKSAQVAIEKLNREQQRDFGTTCVSVTLSEDFLISTACGDSSAVLFGFPKKKTSSSKPGKTPLPDAAPIIIELSRRHHLEDRVEIDRINSDAKGRVIRGDGGILRLIPGTLDYDEAKKRGLSINMSRSMGHQIFSQCGLSHMIDYSLLSLWDLPRLMYQPKPVDGGGGGGGGGHNGSTINPQPRMMRMPALSIHECRTLLINAWKQQETLRMAAAVSRRPTDRIRAISPPNSPAGVGAAVAGGYSLSRSQGGSGGRSLISKYLNRSKLMLGGGGSASGAGDLTAIGTSSGEKQLTSGPSFSGSRDEEGKIKAAKAGEDSEGRGGSRSRRLVAGVSSSSSSSRKNNKNGEARMEVGSDSSMDGGAQRAAKTGAAKIKKGSLDDFQTSMSPLENMYLLLMSDGITDVVPLTTLGGMLRESHQRAQAAGKEFDPASFAARLTEFARGRRSRAGQRADNCTCLAVHLGVATREQIAAESISANAY